MKTQTKKEHSAGGCVYKKENNKTLWLIGQHSGYNKWVLPKGLIENNETPLDAAIRETEEEMGVKAQPVLEKPVHTIDYWFQAKYKPDQKDEIRRVETYQEEQGFKALNSIMKVHKTVDFFLLKYQTGDPQDHDFEMTQAGWHTYQEAKNKLAFDGERDALRYARDKMLQIAAKT